MLIMAVAGQLERGWRRTALIRDLAAGEATQVELAVKYGVTQPSVSAFRDRHEREIDAVRTQLDDKWAALWAADKFNRVAELQSDIETITGEDDEKLLRVKHAALRQIAEELGQLKQVVEVGGSVTYTITGLDPAALT
jgi:hypothetical protein